jgi:hypothetical protein
MRRQVRVVSITFGLATLVGAYITFRILDVPQDPKLFSEAELGQLASLPFPVALPSYLPPGTIRTGLTFFGTDNQASACELTYDGPAGCFVLDAQQTSEVAGAAPSGALALKNPDMGEGWVVATPELRSSSLRDPRGGGTFTLGGRLPPEAHCTHFLSAEEAKKVLESLLPSRKPPPLPPL